MNAIAKVSTLALFLLWLEWVLSLQLLNLRAQLFHHFLQIFDGWNFRLERLRKLRVAR
jgi:hypothetical protein